MAILIDGYNLLNATGVEGVGSGTELARARRGLLLFLSRALSEEQLSATTIVFDAQNAPPGLPSQESFGLINVLYAQDYSEADDLVEELIASDHTPRKLVVVSSDHRLHRAARRRKAKAIDSEVWFAQLRSQRRQLPDNDGDGQAAALTSPADSTQWLAEFADIDVSQIAAEIGETVADITEVARGAADASQKKQPDKPPVLKDGIAPESLSNCGDIFPVGFAAELEAEQQQEEFTDDYNPFPPGYGEDVIDEELG